MSEPLVLAARTLRISRRQVDALVTSVMLPVMLMVVFVELFGGAIDTSGEYVRYVVPGVVLLCAGFSSGLTAVSVCQDLTGGMIDRLRSMDVRPASFLAAHVVASVARNATSGVLVVAVALLLGFRPDAGPLGWIAAVSIVLAFVVALSWLSATIGLVAGSPEAANGFTFLIMFAPYASSAFVPVHTMPSWLQGFATHQPITPLTDAVRALLLAHPAGNDACIALLWCGGILAASIAASTVLFGRRTT